MKERWGVEYALQSEELKEKAKKSTKEKWGVENIFQNKELIKERFKEKWGVDHPMKVDKLKEKAKHSINEKIRKEKDQMNERRRQTNLEKFGVESYAETEQFKEFMKSHNLEKWNKTWFMETEEFKQKSRQTSLENWGEDNYLKSEYSRVNFNISKDPNYVKFLGNKINLMYCEFCKNNFEIPSYIYNSRKKSNLENVCTICNPISDSSSLKEKELLNFIQSIYNGQIIESYRDKLEIDIYLPEMNLGFEFNGLFWHSEEWKDRNYHLEKSEYFKEKEIRIIHIWEDDWNFKRKLVENQVKNQIGLTDNKVFARKCQVKQINDPKVAREFLDRNHIQGFVSSSLKIGLYYNEELVSIMTFDHLEGRKRMNSNSWNINRFCNKINTSVVGGASKLFHHFVRNWNPKRVISYADRDWSEGSLYKTLGFELVEVSGPDYKYLIGGKRKNKQNYKKSNLKIDSTLSETQFMKISNIKRIWDCGKLKFERIL
jgi:hypothetical protein